jgi:ankyrin repeat protein
MSKKQILSSRFGMDQDNFLHHAIKNLQFDVVKYLLTEVKELNLLDANVQGQTALHLAIKTKDLILVKMLCVTDAAVELSKQPTIDDVVDNLNTNLLLQMFKIQN